MAVNLVGTDIIAEEGDSIVDKTLQYLIFNYPMQVVNKQIAPLTSPPPRGTWPPTPVITSKPWPPSPVITSKAWPAAVADKPLPRVANFGVNGATSANLAGRIAADLAALPGCTAFLCHIGINDARTAVPASTTLTNMTTVDTALNGAGVTKKFLSGPLSSGEKWPSGQNDPTIDAAIDALDTALVGWAASHGWTYVSQRTGTYAVYEPLTNTPGPGATSAKVCSGDVNGIHPFGMDAALTGAAIGQRVCGDMILTALSGS